MIELDYSRHAQTRMQQRAIPPIIVEWVLDYGRDLRHQGASVYFLNREDRYRLKREIGEKSYARMENRLGAYVVISDGGSIITVGRRYRRFKQATNHFSGWRGSTRRPRRRSRHVRPS